MFRVWIAAGVVVSLLGVWSVKNQRRSLFAVSGWLAIYCGLLTVAAVLSAAIGGCSANPLGYGFSTNDRARDCDNFVTDILLQDYKLLTALVVGLLALSVGEGILAASRRLALESSRDTKQLTPHL